MSISTSLSLISIKFPELSSNLVSIVTKVGFTLGLIDSKFMSILIGFDFESMKVIEEFLTSNIENVPLSGIALIIESFVVIWNLMVAVTISGSVVEALVSDGIVHSIVLFKYLIVPSDTFGLPIDCALVNPFVSFNLNLISSAGDTKLFAILSKTFDKSEEVAL